MSPTRCRPATLVAALALVIVTTILFVGGVGRPARANPAQPAQPAQSTAVNEEMSAWQAIVLGTVEGLTEYLPVSSTGHLVLAERLMGMPEDKNNDEAKAALDAYTVIIQFGAIIAVLALYRKRVADLFKGLVGKSASGRQLLLCLIAAFIPAAVLGLAFGDRIDTHLLKPGPVAVAWIIGGLVILALYKRLSPRNTGGLALEEMSVKTALFIGCAQAVALWPGTSRSFVTIVGAVLLGMSLLAAVEFSFLLGLVTLTAASAYSALKDGQLVLDTYGTAAPLIGIVFAAISAALAIGTFVRFLGQRDLKGFGIYRIAAGVVTFILMATTTTL